MATSTGAVSGLPAGYALEQPAAPAPQEAPQGLPEGYTLENGSTPSDKSGQTTNDVGNVVIMPKDGESFADTMKRAADQGKTVSQEQIDKEMATAPKKAAEVVGAAPLIGAGLPALEAGGSEALSSLHDFALNKLAGSVLPGMESQAAKQVLLSAVPKAIKFAQDMSGGGMTLLGTYELLKHLMGSDTKK